MTLRENQSKFAKMAAELILKAYELGYEVQSDWGQTGKKEGFANELKEGVDFEVTKRTENILGKKKEIYGIKLNSEDWLALFPETNFKIGTTTLRLMPLTVSTVARVLKQLSGISSLLVEEGLTLKDLSRDNVPAIITLVSVIMAQAPGILSEMSGLDEFDVVDYRCFNNTLVRHPLCSSLLC